MMKKVYRKKFDAKAKAAKVKIAKKSGGDQFKNLKEWVAFYSEHERLPSTKILCSSCKKKATSMFGDNLKRTLPKFGSIEGLLTKFECSDCRKAKAPVKEKKVKVPKRSNSEDGSITEKSNSGKEYLTLDEIEDRKEKIRATLPKFNPDFKPIPYDLNNEDDVIELTKSACQRPDIFLDYGCPECPFYKYCACAVKTDKLRNGNRKSVSSIRRK
jgi:hypothetical protein